MLTDAADMHAERIVCLGDVLGYGPEPVEALELVYRRAHVCLAGNHDDAVAGRYPVQDFTEIAAAAVLLLVFAAITGGVLVERGTGSTKFCRRITSPSPVLCGRMRGTFISERRMSIS